MIPLRYASRDVQIYILIFPVIFCDDLFEQMIPNGKEAEFFSFYEISERGTSWIGPLVFGLANQMFGNLRIAILSLIFFFIMGLILLPFVNVSKAIADAKKYDGNAV